MRATLLAACILWASVPTPTNAQDLRFETPLVLPIAEPLPSAFRIATGDVNGDGKLDIVVGSAAGVVLLLAQADSQFSTGRLIAVSSPCPIPDLALADLDRDGVLDLAVYCASSGKVFTFRGHGDGTFAPPDGFTTSISANSRGMVAADLNQDGVVDLAIAQDGKLTVLLGNGDATFHLGADLKIAGGQSPAQPVALTVADFNGDGIPDLAAANLVYNDDLSIFLGTGGGLFASETKVPTGDRPHDLLAVDFDRDGNVDLAVACDTGLFLFAGDGRGSFRAGPKVLSNDRPVSVATSDLNGDGLPDFVLGGYYNGRITVVLSQGDGTFRPAGTVASIGDVFAVVLVDLNGDSLPDLIATSYSGSSALLAMGRGNGDFEQPMYFGSYPANSFPVQLADTDGDGTAELAVILQGRRSIGIVHRDSEKVSIIRRSDYPLDGVFADFDGDGVPDLALVTVPMWQGGPEGDFNAAIRLLPGHGDGTFGGEIVTPIDRCPAYHGYGSLSSRFLTLAAGDFDGDGILDIALVNLPLQELQVYHGNGDGTFAMTQRFPIKFGGVPVSADFDGDGIQDLALLDGQVTVFYGNADGGMIRSESTAGCQVTGTIAKGDFDGDGKTDLFLNCGSELFALLNSGDRQFRAAPKVDLNTPYSTVSTVGDFDGDGRDDVAIRNYANPSQPVVILLNDGSGTFRTRVVVHALLDPASMVAMDFDGDGRLDLVVADASDGTLKVLLNKSAAIP